MLANKKSPPRIESLLAYLKASSALTISCHQGWGSNFQVRSGHQYPGTGTKLRCRWWSQHWPSLATQRQRCLFSFRSFPSEVSTFSKREECEDETTKVPCSSSSFRPYSGLFNSFQYYLLEVSAMYSVREECEDESHQNCDHKGDKVMIGDCT